MKQINILRSTSDETGLLEHYIKKLGVPLKVFRPGAGFNMYKEAAENHDDIYVMGKLFGQGVKFRDDPKNDWRRMFRLDQYRHLHFIEKPPYRFKQGVDNTANALNCGVMITNISSFCNDYLVRDFLSKEYDKKEVKEHVDSFRDHWIDKNEPRELELNTKNIIYFPLQLPQDSSIRVRGYDTCPVNEMISTVYKIFSRLWNNFKIVVREHPFHRNNYKYNLDFNDKDKLMITNKIPHADLLKCAEVVVSFNSSCLAEAILLRKKVMYFSNLPTVDCSGIGLRIHSWNYFNKYFLNEMAVITKDYLMHSINEDLYNKYVYYITKELSFFNNFTTDDNIKEFLLRKFDL